MRDFESQASSRRNLPTDQGHTRKVFRMLRTMLKSKIHQATLTGTELHYEGSIAIDQDLLDQANILPGEQVQVLNANNASRLITYAISAPRGSCTFMLNGPAARMAVKGDIVSVLSYCQLEDEQARNHEPVVLLMDRENRPVSPR